MDKVSQQTVEMPGLLSWRGTHIEGLVQDVNDAGSSNDWAVLLGEVLSRESGGWSMIDTMLQTTSRERTWINKQRKRWADCSCASFAPSFFMLQFCAVFATVSRSMANLLSAAVGLSEGPASARGSVEGRVARRLTTLLEAREQLPVDDDVGVASGRERGSSAVGARNGRSRRRATHRMGLVCSRGRAEKRVRIGGATRGERERHVQSACTAAR